MVITPYLQKHHPPCLTTILKPGRFVHMREAGSLVNDAMGYLLRLNAPSGKATEHNNDE